MMQHYLESVFGNGEPLLMERKKKNIKFLDHVYKVMMIIDV